MWELQGRQAELRRHVLQLTSQINTAERERSMLDITVKEMDAMPDQTRVYMAVGKMFALRKKKQLRSDLIAARDDSQKKDEGRKSLRDQFMTKLKESENLIDEVTEQIEAARMKASGNQNTSPSS